MKLLNENCNFSKNKLNEKSIHTQWSSDFGSTFYFFPLLVTDKTRNIHLNDRFNVNDDKNLIWNHYNVRDKYLIE